MAAIGSITGPAWIVTLGLLVSGVGVLAIAKLGMEIRTLGTALSSELQRVETTFASMVDDVASANQECVNRLDANEGDIRRARDEISHLSERHSSIQKAIGEMTLTDEALARRIRRTAARLKDSQKDLKRRLAEVEAARAAIEGAIAANRHLLEKIGRRVSQPSASLDLAELARPKVDRPTLSIAIPSYNRPDYLAECLDSLERAMSNTPGGVEVCITDDASSDPDTLEVAVEHVRKSSVASLHRNSTNLGLERNLLQACEPCRGDYILVLGNDDRLREGSLATILTDIHNGLADVYLYDKVRITQDGRPIDRGDRTVPVEIPAGTAHLFPTLLDAARRQGILSTFGFISTVVFRRSKFASVQAEQYLDLTMYPLVLVLLEAFSKRPVQFRNVAIVQHRSPRQTQKWSESLGLKEDVFMRGGSARAARYFGTTLAAGLQRVIDRSAVAAEVLAQLPERLLTERSLVDWIAECRTIDPNIDDTLDDAVVADADRFFESLALPPTKPRDATDLRKDTLLQHAEGKTTSSGREQP